MSQRRKEIKAGRAGVRPNAHHDDRGRSGLGSHYFTSRLNYRFFLTSVQRAFTFFIRTIDISLVSTRIYSLNENQKQTNRQKAWQHLILGIRFWSPSGFQATIKSSNLSNLLNSSSNFILVLKKDLFVTPQITEDSW